MKKKYFLCEYLLQGLILANATTNLIPLYLFLILFTILLWIIYRVDGFQTSTLYYFPIAFALLIGRYLEVASIDTMICVSIVIIQYADSHVYNLLQNKKLAGFRKIEEENQEYYQFYPIDGSYPSIARKIKWNQGRALEKIIQSKKINGITQIYYRLTMSYIDRIMLRVGEGTQKLTKNGMAFCHSQNAAPLWYSSLFIHFASNGFKVGARQHSNIQILDNLDKIERKKLREKQIKELANQYYSTIIRLNCDKIVLAGHSYGCSALLQAYFDHKEQLQQKVTHIILMDPYFFPLQDKYLTAPINCPILVIENQYLLNIQDMYLRHKSFIDKPNVECIIWKEGSDIYFTDLCFFFNNSSKDDGLSWDARFQMNFEAINAFMQKKDIEGLFELHNLGKEYKPETFWPEKLFNF